jgi:hypothetical protein
MCEAKFPPVVHLEEDFPVLAHMDFSEMELPGQFQHLEFSPESCVFVVRLGTRVSLIRRHGVSMRRIELVCSDGITRYFTVSATQAHNLSSTDQRMMSVYRCARQSPSHDIPGQLITLLECDQHCSWCSIFPLFMARSFSAFFPASSD